MKGFTFVGRRRNLPSGSEYRWAVDSVTIQAETLGEAQAHFDKNYKEVAERRDD